MYALQRRTRCLSGFTLLEIIVIVTIIGLLCAIALPAYKKLQQRSVNTLLGNELRVAAGALEYYVFDKGSWPPDGEGGWPTELNGYLPPPDRWHKPTPIGGTWAWALNTDDTVASLRINNYTIPSAQVTAIDRMIDDGDPLAGTVLIAGQSLVYVLER